MNRIPNDKNEQYAEEINRRLNIIRDHAATLYDLMSPGMIIRVSLEEVPALIVPGQTPRTKHLLIMRPVSGLEVQG